MGEDNRAIGVFDSGIGGLTAMRELSALLPHEDIVYFGDTGRVPYGTRSRETIVKYARQDARFLCSFDLKLLLIACGTASYAALETLQKELPIPVFGVVEGASRRAVEVTRVGRVAVLATPATISGHVFGNFLKGLSQEITVIEKACPLFVPVVENGRFRPEDPLVRILTEEYLAPVREAGADTIILGLYALSVAFGGYFTLRTWCCAHKFGGGGRESSSRFPEKKWLDSSGRAYWYAPLFC